MFDLRIKRATKLKYTLSAPDSVKQKSAPDDCGVLLCAAESRFMHNCTIKLCIPLR